MEFMGTRAASEKWGYTQATISKWCRERVIYAEHDKPGSPWRIPIDTDISSINKKIKTTT